MKYLAILFLATALWGQTTVQDSTEYAWDAETKTVTEIRTVTTVDSVAMTSLEKAHEILNEINNIYLWRKNVLEQDAKKEKELTRLWEVYNLLVQVDPDVNYDQIKHQRNGDVDRVYKSIVESEK